MDSLIYALYLLSTLAVMGHLLYQRRPTQTLIIWLLLVLLLPLFGALIYLLFGSRKVFARHGKPPLQFHQQPQPETPSAPSRRMMRLLAQDGIPPAQPGPPQECTLSPATARDWFFEAIENAKHTIWLESYIFEPDSTGRALLAQLTAKAKDGVDVRLLIDAFGSFNAYLRPSLFQPLRAAGGQVAFFQPPGSLFKSRINLRNHRKIYLFDQKILLSGGINLAAEYLDPDQPHSWVDLTFRATGPLVPVYAQTFAQDWHYTTAQPLHLHPPALSTKEGVLAQAIPSGPDMPADTLREVLLNALYQAESHILIVTPYFIPDETVLEAVLLACKRGVAVQLLTPSITDHRIFDLGRAPYMRQLHEAGGQIHLYTPTMLHAKAVIIDDTLAMIGSANLDYRSLLINYELVTLLYTPAEVARLRRQLATLLTNTTLFTPPPGTTAHIRENLARIITPLL